MTCVQCQNGSVAYWVSWTAGERTRRMTTDSGQGRMFLLRWGGVVEHDGRQVIPLNSELGRLQTVSTLISLTREFCLFSFRFVLYIYMFFQL